MGIGSFKDTAAKKLKMWISFFDDSEKRNFRLNNREIFIKFGFKFPEMLANQSRYERSPS